MTLNELRDSIALRVLVALIARTPTHLTPSPLKLAETAYELADAMMKVRARPGPTSPS